MKIIDILNETKERLINASIENNYFEARMLVGHVLRKSKEWIMLNLNENFPEDNYEELKEMVDKRVFGVPLQYIIGSCCFLGNDFLVNENVLIPRADTEVWVEKIIELANSKRINSILDLCTGSGCIAISLKKTLKNIDVYAVDISESALDIARKNAENNETNVHFIKSDLFNDLKNVTFDVIVSNPPYIPTEEINDLQKEVLNEPFIALDGGNDGLDFYRKIISKSREFLNVNGYLALEIGYNQAEQVGNILKENNFKVYEIIKDYAQNTRCILSQKGEMYE